MSAVPKLTSLAFRLHAVTDQIMSVYSLVYSCQMQNLKHGIERGANSAAGWKALAELQYQNRQFQDAYDTAVNGLEWSVKRRRAGHEQLTSFALALRLVVAQCLRRLQRLDEAEYNFQVLAGECISQLQTDPLPPPPPPPPQAHSQRSKWPSSLVCALIRLHLVPCLHSAPPLSTVSFAIMVLASWVLVCCSCYLFIQACIAQPLQCWFSNLLMRFSYLSLCCLKAAVRLTGAG